jgi:hypothetical protein
MPGRLCETATEFTATAQLAVSLACLVIIGAGARYAWARETLRDTDPHEIYMQINRKSFDSALPDIPVAWAYAGEDRYGQKHFYADGSDIEIDNQKVLSENFLREVVRHESCHVATRSDVEVSHQDVHGALFEECMKRFR